MTNILVVEDDPIIRQTVEYSLKRAGFSVNVVADGALALKAAEHLQPDLVLLDLMLPGMDGYEIAERLRAYAPADAQHAATWASTYTYVTVK